MSIHNNLKVWLWLWL